MNKNKLSIVSMGLALALFLALNLFTSVSLRSMRADLTEGNLFTLSDGTRNVLAGLDEPVDVTFYWSKEQTGENPMLNAHARRVQELLEEYQAHAQGNLRLQVIEPLAFSEEEDEALAAGLRGPQVDEAGNRLFLGLVVRNSVDAVETMPFLDPRRESFLEYDLTRSLTRLADQGLKVVGVLSPLPLAGGAQPPPGMPQQQQPEPAWAIWEFLSQSLELRDLGTTLTHVPADIDVLLVIHPKDLSPSTEYALDQYALAGGRMMVFVDPFSMFDPAGQAAQPGMGASRSSSLDALFKAWGIAMTPGQIVGDVQSADRTQGNDGRPVACPVVMRLEPDRLDQHDLVTKGLGALVTLAAGELTILEDSPLQAAPLFTTTSEGGGIMDAAMLQFSFDPAMIAKTFSPDGTARSTAFRLSGEFKSAFPDGPPSGPDGAPVDASNHLAESSATFNGIVVSDVDLLHEYLWARRRNMLGMTFIEPVNSNGNFVTNAVDNLTGSNDLISLRSRQVQARPFTLKQDLRREADKRFRDRYDEFNAQLQATEQKIAELQGPNSEGAMNFSAEQEQELASLLAERDQLRKDLRKVRFDLNRDIESLGARLQFLNVIALPGMVLLMGALLLLMRSRSSNARKSTPISHAS